MIGSPTVPVISHDRMLEAIRILGFDPEAVRTLTITRHYVEVELTLKDERGRRMAAGDEMATAVMRIPIGEVPRFDRADKIIA